MGRDASPARPSGRLGQTAPDFLELTATPQLAGLYGGTVRSPLLDGEVHHAGRNDNPGRAISSARWLKLASGFAPIRRWMYLGLE